MEIEASVIDYIAKTFYHLTPDENSIVSLCGYTDKNFTFTTNNVDKYVLKIVHESESVQDLVEIVDEIIGSASQYENSKFFIPKPIKTITTDKYSAMVTIRVKDLKIDDYKDSIFNIKLCGFYPSITLIEFINDCQDYYSNERIYNQLGEFCYELCKFFRKNCHLVEQLKILRTKTKFAWSLMDAQERIIKLADKFYPDKKHERRILIDKTLDEYNNVKDLLEKKLPNFIIHGDLCGQNILLNMENYVEKERKQKSKEKFCLIDFQDIQVAPQIVELSILILYNILNQKNIDFEEAIICIGRWTLEGFQKNNLKSPLISEDELILIPFLMRFRLCQSLLNGLFAFEGDPTNDYVMNTNIRGWYLLDLFTPSVGNDADATIYSDKKKLLNCWLSPKSEFNSFKRKLLVR